MGINLKDIMWDKCSGQYDYKLNNTYYQLYKYNSYWVVYETEQIEHNTPHDWTVVNTCSTLKEAKESLVRHISTIANLSWEVK